MSDSSQPKKSTEDLLNDQLKDLMITAGGTGAASDCITITLPNDIISGGDPYGFTDNMNGTYTLTGTQAGPVYTINASDTITVGDINFNWGGEEWLDKFPDWERVKDMCSKYPGLDIALRNFETIYKLVKDDYDNPTPKK